MTLQYNFIWNLNELFCRNSPMIWWPFNNYISNGTFDAFSRNSPMIWWPFNKNMETTAVRKEVVTHQWSGDPSIRYSELLVEQPRRNSPMIWWPFNKSLDFLMVGWLSRNSPMIWWPFNYEPMVVLLNIGVVTHQWSGDPSIASSVWSRRWECRNSPMIWWPFN